MIQPSTLLYQQQYMGMVNFNTKLFYVKLLKENAAMYHQSALRYEGAIRY